ncbi:hypothetical protein PVAND_002407 [Polypedilum vanderplanki]|uniref:Small ribosomal subunit protein mS38 n=1 Tax=Polypedilum vanderplanki TaxID=319348 RepID=A0A9J6BS26_POLVA|nr:hypothetical protein PVAND_002407 [Polypedilum vanderplanki]
MLFLRQIKGISICSRLASISIRNLNVSSNSSPLSVSSSLNPAFLHNIEKSKLNGLSLQSTASIVNEIGYRQPIWKKEIFELPLTNKIVEIPTQINQKIIEEITNIDKTINLPTGNKSDENGKQAARLIQIRKRKMKKHKLRKLRKKMKFVWGRAKQRREWKKERRFLNGLLDQIKVAQKFSAEEFVEDKIRKATTDPLPRHYKGRKLPQWLIRELLEKDRLKAVEKKYQFWEECGKK